MKNWAKILIGLIAGVIAGALMGEKAAMFQVFGTAFIRLLNMLVILIIFSSLVVGVCHISDPRKLGRISFRMLAFYAASALIAAFVSISLALWIEPGKGLVIPLAEAATSQQNGISFSDFFLSLIPFNPFTSFSEGRILQVIIFAIVLGVSITYSKERGLSLLRIIESLAKIMYKMTHFVMMLAPYGVFALIASMVGSIGWKIVLPLGKFLLINYIACFFQLFIVFALSIRYIGHLKIIPFFRGMKDAIILAFTTSSSSATLPVTLKCTQKHLGIKEDISGFIISLGSTINMNGAVIGQSISALFIAQAYGIELSGMKIVILILISLISSVGAAGISGAGIIMLSLVLHVMGLPLEGIALVAGIDRFREMVATVINVLGDATAALIVAKGEKAVDEETYYKATWTDSGV